MKTGGSKDPAGIVARRTRVRGHVQGVGFRWYAKEHAREIGLAGWVQNLPDGSVEAWLEGAPATVEAMIAWLRHGPPAARVETVDVSEVEPSGASRFEVRR
jgi:acylphosphatase